MRAAWRASWLGVAALLVHCDAADPASTHDTDPVQADDGGGQEAAGDAGSADGLGAKPPFRLRPSSGAG